MKRSLLCTALGLALAAGGCSNSKTAGKTNGDGNGANGETGCEVDQILDGQGQCRTLCADDEDCGEGEECFITTGLCVPAETPECDPTVEVCEPVEPCEPGDPDCDPIECDPDRCEEGWVCPEPGSDQDDGLGSCVPGDGYCVENGDCNFGERCDNGRCVSRVGDVVQTCTTDAECGLMMQCVLGVCTGCVDDLQCGEDASCVMGTCVVGQAGTAAQCLDADCPEGQRCNPTTGTCEIVCETNDDCDEGQMCAPVLNRCVTDATCTSDDECEGELTCTAMEGELENGVCTGCSDEVPCPAGTACVIGSCFPDVTANACTDVECSEGELCDPQDGSCYPEDGTCASDDDCREGHSCNGLLHICTGCSGDGDCRPEQRCVFGGCVAL